MSNPKFQIFDWAGNLKSEQKFDTFEDAWEYIYGPLTKTWGLTDEDYEEYEVKEVKE